MLKRLACVLPAVPDCCMPQTGTGCRNQAANSTVIASNTAITFLAVMDLPADLIIPVFLWKLMCPEAPTGFISTG